MPKTHCYFVYILKCSDASYYVGVTNNLVLRLQQHQEGINPKAYTFTRRPLELVYQKEFQYINDAIAFEKQLKGWSRKKKEALINGNWDALPLLAKKKFEGW